MKTFFSSKLNIILTILLLTILSTAGFFAYRLLVPDEKIKVPDFTGKSEADVDAWCNSLKELGVCTITHEYSDTVEEGKIIYQSLNTGETVDEHISFIISDGKNNLIDPPVIDSKTTKEDISTWAANNFIEKIAYYEENSDTIEEGKIIRIEPSSGISEDTQVNVYISSGPSAKIDDKDLEIDAGEYVGISLDDFQKKMKALSLVPKYEESYNEYSSSVKEGYIIWHGSGTYEKNENIRYALSKGENPNGIIVKPGDFVGLSLDEFKTKATALGLVPKYRKDYDEESSTVAKGKIVWHGSGNYEKGEGISYALSLGSNEIVIESGQFIGLNTTDFEKKVKELGLVPNHKSEKDEEGTDSNAGDIAWHGSGTYVQNETINYGIYLSNEIVDGKVTIDAGKYKGLSQSEFESKMRSLGLVPTHVSSYDEESSSVPSGYIVWHGSGTYEKNEQMKYALSLGNSSGTTYISKGQYVGKSVSEFENIAKALNLNPKYTDEYDDYSDTVAKGDVIWHGSGDYVKNEDFRYSKSLGKKESTPTTETVNVGDYAGKSESELTSFLTNNGLKSSRSESYSTILAAGKIISNDTGSFSAGSTVKYTVSKGEEPISTGTIMKASKYATAFKGETYDETKSKLQNGPFSSFTNVTYNSAESTDGSGAGVIASISVNGSTSYTEGDYPLNTPIVITIYSKQAN